MPLVEGPQDYVQVDATLPSAVNFGPAERAYTLQAGDTLFDVALRHNTTVDAIAALNPGLEPSHLTVGQVIRIPAPQPAQEQKP